MPPDERRTAPARRWQRGPYVSIQVNVDKNGNNILNDAANEPSIAVDPNLPQRMAAHVAYAATFNGEQDVYYLRIVPEPDVFADGFEGGDLSSWSGSSLP